MVNTGVVQDLIEEVRSWGNGREGWNQYEWNLSVRVVHTLESLLDGVGPL